MVVMNERKYSVTELVKMLEEALPVGQVVVVGNGKEMTKQQKEWLASIAGMSTKCNCPCCDCDEDTNDYYASGYDDGYADGYAEAEAEADSQNNEVEELSSALTRIREVLDEAGLV